MNAVDTNVFVYAHDLDEPAKRTRALDLLRVLTLGNEETILLWQVVGEVVATFRRWQDKGRMTAEQVEATFNSIVSLFPVVQSPIAIFALSFDLRSKFSLSHWDSMLIAAAKVAGVTTLYSEDMQHGCDYDGVVVVNPFIGC